MTEEEIKNLKIRYDVIRWDIEYWQSYIEQYKNNKISCSPEQTKKDLQKCIEEEQKYIKILENFKLENAAYLIF